MGPETERSLAFAFAPIPFSLGSLRNGAQQSLTHHVPLSRIFRVLNFFLFLLPATDCLPKF
jgi:hypothetical protein